MELNDYQILGVNEKCTPQELKRAFRKKSKAFHPDTNKNSYGSHLAMIRLNQAYLNLKKILPVATPRAERNDDEETAYKIYREGITYFQKIHPSQWKKVNDIYNAHAIETNPEANHILDELIGLMAKAYGNFSAIVCEYPASCWFHDSKLKIQEIEKMTIRYEKIKKSYERG